MTGRGSSELAAADTQSFYEQNAWEYFNSTKSIDVRVLRQRFLAYVPPGGLILDAGSGSGRDTKAFHTLGYRADAFDSSPAMAQLSSSFTGIRTQVRRFEEFDDPVHFDGIWACASLLHVSENELPDVFRRLGRALKPGGALYASFKRGHGERVAPDGRRFTNMTVQALRELVLTTKGMLVREVWEDEVQSDLKGNEIWVSAIAVRSQSGERL